MQTDVEIIPVKQRKQTARREILERPIDQDQEIILERWAQTLIHTGTSKDPAYPAHLRATKIMTWVMAAIAQGTFEVSTSGEAGTFKRPSNALCVADYLSHASRVMIDLSLLSDHNRAQFLKQFPRDELDARPSSHRTQRIEGILTEEKTLGHGVKGTLLNVVDAVGEKTKIGPLAARIGIQGPALTDYGVDIQMGGIGQTNLCGGISERGRDGHVLIHLGTDSVMIGLEQTKPVSNQDMQDFIGKAGDATLGAARAAWDYVSRRPSPPASPDKEPSIPKLAHDDDETCGLSGEHSLLGHSDDYTSAGSLYFSNLIYKIKLLENKGELTPAKYNGMRVQLTDGNFHVFVEYFKALSTARRNQNVTAIKQLLKRSPRTALRDDLVEVEVQDNYLSLVKNITPDDLNACFKQLKDIYGDEGLDESKALIEQKLNDIQAWLGEPRRLPNDSRVLNVFRDGEIRSMNPHVKRLERTLNHTVLRLKQMAIDELRLLQANPSPVISDMRILRDAYDAVRVHDTTSPAFTTFRKQEDDLFLMSRSIQQASVDDPAFPFGYLIQLPQLESEITQTVSTMESRALIQLMKNQVALQSANQTLTIELQAAGAALDATIARIEEMRAEAEAQWAAIQAEHDALRHPLPPVEVPEEAMPAPDDGAANPEHPPIQNEAPTWDWAFVWQCMSCPAALNTYGTVLMLASLVIAGAAAAGAIPLVLGTSLAVSGLALSAACFFSARPHHPPTADTAAADVGLEV